MGRRRLVLHEPGPDRSTKTQWNAMIRGGLQVLPAQQRTEDRNFKTPEVRDKVLTKISGVKRRVRP